MKMEVGDYVRIEKGEISKIKFIFNQLYEENNIIIATLFLKNGDILIYPDDKFKISKNIIDLIEEGDYVNGNKVIRIETSSYPEDKNVKIIVCCGNDDYYFYYNEDIKTILIKEQYENNCYRIEE